MKTPTTMEDDRALAWIEQVGGIVYRQRDGCEAESCWVAVIRTPATRGGTGKIILACGESLTDAACAAEAQWDEIWGALSSVH